MRFCRFNDHRLGVVRDALVHDVTAVLDGLPPLRWPTPQGDHFFNHFESLRPRMQTLADALPGVPVSSVRLLSPVANPGKIVAAPVNYQLHLDESRADKAINFGNQVKTISDCRLDTPNFAYSLSFAQKQDWPQQFSRQPEIQSYLATVASASGLKRQIRFGTEVDAMRFNEDRATWTLTVRDRSGGVTEEEFNAVITAVGILSRPSLPDIAGLDNYPQPSGA